MTSHPPLCGCCCHWGWCMYIRRHVNIEVYDMKLFKQNYRFIFPSFTMNMRKYLKLWHSNYPLGRNRPICIFWSTQRCMYLVNSNVRLFWPYYDWLRKKDITNYLYTLSILILKLMKCIPNKGCIGIVLFWCSSLHVRIVLQHTLQKIFI